MVMALSRVLVMVKERRVGSQVCNFLGAGLYVIHLNSKICYQA